MGTRILLIALVFASFVSEAAASSPSANRAPSLAVEQYEMELSGDGSWTILVQRRADAPGAAAGAEMLILEFPATRMKLLRPVVTHRRTVGPQLEQIRFTFEAISVLRPAARSHSVSR